MQLADLQKADGLLVRDRLIRGKKTLFTGNFDADSRRHHLVATVKLGRERLFANMVWLRFVVGTWFGLS